MEINKIKSAKSSIFGHIAIFCFLLMSIISSIGYLVWYEMSMLIIAIIGIIMLVVSIILLNKYYIIIYNQPTYYERLILIISPSIVGIGCIDIYLCYNNLIVLIICIFGIIYISWEFIRVNRIYKIMSDSSG
jgi:ABC-type multidrug transport system permease subunit